MIKRDQAYALNRTLAFMKTIMDAPEEHLVVMTLAVALSHVKNISPNVCYVLATGEKESGKSTLTQHIPLLLASNPFQVSRLTSSDAVRNAFLSRDTVNTLVFDDASKIWGASGRSSLMNIQTQLAVNAYSDLGQVSVSRSGVPVTVQAYAVCFFNGLGDVIPEDAATRCIKLPLAKRAEGARRMKNAGSPRVRSDAVLLKRELSRWANSRRREMAEWLTENDYKIHPLLDNRLLQLWGPPFAIANAAGGDWPRLCMEAFLSLGLDASEKPVVQRDEQALLDVARIAVQSGARVLFYGDLLRELRRLPDAFYRQTGSRDLYELLEEVMGPSAPVRGKNMDGKVANAEGWAVAPVLREAAELQRALRPAVPEAGEDRVARALRMEIEE